MALWIIKPGRRGEHEDYFLEQDVACLTFPNMPSVRDINSSEKMKLLFVAVRPNAPKRAAINYASQAWAFRGLCRVGDSIVLPLKSSSGIVVGRVASDYRYNKAAEDPYRHERDVAWSNRTIARNRIDVDLRYSFAANKTFCETRRNAAESRIQRLLEVELNAEQESVAAPPDSTSGEIILDSEIQSAWQKLKCFVEQTFTGHDLTHLFAELLKADGYHIYVSPEGPDGGRDILAARGEFGFERPRICVQVKRTSKPVAAPVFRELLGTMQVLRATHGMLVSWSGFTQAVHKEALNRYFDVRLVDGDEVIRMVLARYRALPADLKKRLPLRRAWVFKRDQSAAALPDEQRSDGS